jgi:hypothetical protein
MRTFRPSDDMGVFWGLSRMRGTALPTRDETAEGWGTAWSWHSSRALGEPPAISRVSTLTVIYWRRSVLDPLPVPYQTHSRSLLKGDKDWDPQQLIPRPLPQSGSL